MVFVLAIGGLLPLRWYLGLAEGYDERFAWRMFSPERMVRCKFAFIKDGEAIRLHGRFHEAWITTLQRGRMSTARAMASRLCEEEGPPIEVRWVCREVDGTQRDWGSQGRDVCGGW